MTNEKDITRHYRHGDLLNEIEAAIVRLGKTIDSISIGDLAAVDEFHIGGRAATSHFLSQLKLTEQDTILDIGCGLGGAARYAAQHYNVSVTGIDLTREYIETGNTLSRWVKLDNQVSLQRASATAIPFTDAAFDGAYMLHVGMNIADKSQLFTEIYRVLRPGAYFGIYDVMRFDNGALSYPVPWAAGNSSCSVATPEQYRTALGQAGFELLHENNRRVVALDFFKKIHTDNRATGRPPLGLHTLMQESTAIKTKNMIANIKTGYISPVEFILQKPI